MEQQTEQVADMLTVREVMKLTGTPRSTITWLLREQKVPGALKVGSETRRGIWLIPATKAALDVIRSAGEKKEAAA